MSKQTCLFQTHTAAGGRMVDFGGWDMPLHYGSQLDEHHLVRDNAGMFDVSHMTIVDITGANGQPRAFLQRLLANDIDKASVIGKAVYSCMLNEAGGVIDDLIAYWRGGDNYRLVVNAATHDKDIAWLSKVAADFEVTLNERSELGMIAVQGPNACALAASVLPKDLAQDALALKPFVAVENDELFVARTGYTGENGFEIIVHEDAAAALWQQFVVAGIAPCGLGARDTLRLEAGLNLYGSDMDETTTPLESNLAWTVAMDEGRNFIGANALREQQKVGVKRKLVGLVLEGRGVLRDHQAIVCGDNIGAGEITSGGFSPSMQRSIALARVSIDCPERAHADVRGRLLDVRLVQPPFVRNGKIKVSLD